MFRVLETVQSQKYYVSWNRIFAKHVGHIQSPISNAAAAYMIKANIVETHILKNIGSAHS